MALNDHHVIRSRAMSHEREDARNRLVTAAQRHAWICTTGSPSTFAAKVRCSSRSLYGDNAIYSGAEFAESIATRLRRGTQ